MVGKNKKNYTKPAYQLFLDDFRTKLSKKERSNSKKVIKDGALAWSNLKKKAKKKSKVAIEKLNKYKEEAEMLRNVKITKKKEFSDDEVVQESDDDESDDNESDDDESDDDESDDDESDDDESDDDESDDVVYDYYVDFDLKAALDKYGIADDKELDYKLEKQYMYMVAHPGADSTPYD